MDHPEVVIHVIQCSKMISYMDLPKAIEKAQRALDIGPMIDPTLWQKQHKNLEHDLKILRAAMPLWTIAKRMQEGLNVE